MEYGIIDIGSNTTRLCVYQVQHGQLHCIDTLREYTLLLEKIEHGCLTIEGVNILTQVLLLFQDKSAEYHCTIEDGTLFCFSTASLRQIKNQQAVIEHIKQTTGIVIEPISGEQEAYYNFRSVCFLHPQEAILGADLGGGSMQLFCGRESSGLQQYISLPLGGLRLSREFVSGTIPTIEEASAIKQHTTALLEQSNFPVSKASQPFYCMGGTIRLAHKLFDRQEMERCEIEQLIHIFLKHPNKAQQTIHQYAPQREQSFLPGMIAIAATINYLQVQTVIYTNTSVREGYLSEKQLRLDKK